MSLYLVTSGPSFNNPLSERDDVLHAWHLGLQTASIMMWSFTTVVPSCHSHSNVAVLSLLPFYTNGISSAGAIGICIEWFRELRWTEL